MAAATRWILYFASKRRTCKEQLALGAVAYESIAMRKAYWGSCIGMVGRNTTEGMPPASFASPSHICRFKGAASSSAVFVQVQGSPPWQGAPSRGQPAQCRGIWANLTDVFLYHRSFYWRFFESGSKKISAFGTVALKTVALKEHASIGIAGRNRRAGLSPAFVHLPQIAPFMRRPFLHLNQGQLTGNAQNRKR